MMNVPMNRETPLLLMVDDVPNNLQVLGNILATENYDIEAATNGEQALMLAEKNHPNLILLDVMMPVLDGFDVCKRLKANKETRDIPIIFLTARTETEDVIEGLKLGAVDYVTKPFNSYELLARVKTHLELQKRAAQLIALNNERKELLHVLCHDLTNSVGAIEVIMSLVKVEPDSEDLKQDVINAAHSGRELIDLVRNIRAVEEKKVRMGPVMLKQALDDSLVILRNQFQRKNISVDMQIDPSLKVYAERTSLTHSVFNNLLTNALKFSHAGSTITIRGGLVNEDQVLVEISDQGIGIPERMIESLFDLNRSISRSGTHGEKGTGFGMPMVMKFVGFYGGRIEVRSVSREVDADNCGTIVSVYLRASSSGEDHDRNVV